jgi:hypothetical protein
MAEKETSNVSNVNYNCPGGCWRLDNKSLPLCPTPYWMCPICIKKTQPDLYKQIFPEDKSVA